MLKMNGCCRKMMSGLYFDSGRSVTVIATVLPPELLPGRLPGLQ